MAMRRPDPSAIPPGPGVYLYRDGAGEVVYVGKARMLRQRVLSYFRTEGLAPKTKALMARAERVEFLATTTEKEAFLLEASLIKKHRPRYNILLRDDKQYALFRVNLKAPYPRIEIVRRAGKDGARYFGPFTSALAARETWKLLHRAFPLRRCADRAMKNRVRPCLYHHMGQCLAPCTGKVAEEAYLREAEAAVRVLDGKSDALLKELEAAMLEASDRLEFERAAALRDQMRAVRQTVERQAAVLPGGGDMDAVGLSPSDKGLALAVVFVRQGAVQGGRSYFWPGLAFEDASELLWSFLGQFYAEYMPPGRILLPWMPLDAEEADDADAAEDGEAAQDAEAAQGAETADGGEGQAGASCGTEAADGADGAGGADGAEGKGLAQGRDPAGPGAARDAAARNAGPDSGPHSGPDAGAHAGLASGSAPDAMADALPAADALAVGMGAAGRTASGRHAAAVPASGAAEPGARQAAGGIPAQAAGQAAGQGAGQGARHAAAQALGEHGVRDEGAGAADAAGPSAGVLAEAGGLARAAMEQTLAERRNGPVRIVAPQNAQDRQLVDIAAANAREEARLKERGGADAVLARIGAALGLGQPPARIECVDVSHTGGSATRVGLVVWTGGLHQPELSRAYALEGTGGDDYKALHDWAGRRIASGPPWPDLLLVDGGRGQLAAVARGLAGQGKPSLFPLAGIAKARDEAGHADRRAGNVADRIFLPGRSDAVAALREGSPELLFLQNVRDSAHRFAVSRHRRARGKAALQGELTRLPGIGPATARLLWDAFGSIEAMRRASLAELEQLPGIGPAKARGLHARLHGEAPDQASREARRSAAERGQGRTAGQAQGRAKGAAGDARPAAGMAAWPGRPGRPDRDVRTQAGGSAGTLADRAAEPAAGSPAGPVAAGGEEVPAGPAGGRQSGQDAASAHACQAAGKGAGKADGASAMGADLRQAAPAARRGKGCAKDPSGKP